MKFIHEMISSPYDFTYQNEFTIFWFQITSDHFVAWLIIYPSVGSKIMQNNVKRYGKITFSLYSNFDVTVLYFPKQPSRGVLRKRYSERVFSSKFAAYFQETFLKNTYGRLLLYFWHWNKFRMKHENNMWNQRLLKSV